MGEILLERLNETYYRINIQSVKYNSPHFPISIYADKDDEVEGHFIIWRKDPINDIFAIGISHSKEDLPEKTCTHARDLAERFAKRFSFGLVETIEIHKKDGSLQGVCTSYSLGQGS